MEDGWLAENEGLLESKKTGTEKRRLSTMAESSPTAAASTWVEITSTET